MPKYSGISYFPNPVQLFSLNGNTGIQIFGAAAGDQSGFAVSPAGDFNNDTYKDILIGTGVYSGGRSYVVYGNSTIGNAGIFDLVTINGFNGVQFNSALYLGYGLGYADLNKDGISDIALGAPGDSSYTGSSYIVFGGMKIGQQSGGTFSVSTLTGTNGFKIPGYFTGELNGFAFSGCDFNGDGYRDLGITGYYGSPSGRTQGGTGYVVDASVGIGSSGTFLLSGLNGNTGSMIYSPSAGYSFGYSGSPSTGDFNNDGYQDIAFGAPGSTAGTAYVIFGKNGSSNAVLDLASLNSSAFVAINGATSGDNCGASIGFGDFNGDGISDIIVGAPYASPQGKTQAGISYIVLGPWNGTTLSLSNPNNSYIIEGLNVNDRSGGSVGSAGDFNGDGITDFFIGAQDASPNGRTHAGIIYLMFGNTKIVSGSSFNLSNLNGMNGLSFYGAAAGDYSGGAYSSGIYLVGSIAGIGDFNGDKIDDLLIGAYAASPSGRSGAGTAYVVYGDASPQILTNTILILDGGSTILNTTWLNATDINHSSSTFNYSISNVTNGYFSLANSTIPIYSFNNSQLIGNKIQFVHSGNHIPSSYSIGVNTTGLAYLPPQPANVTFVRTIPPQILTKQFTIAQGQTVTLNGANFNLTDVYSAQNPLNLRVNFSSLQHLWFNSTNSNTTVTVFTQNDLLNRKISVTQDGTSNTPSAMVSGIDDTGLTSTSVPVNINYISAPQIVNNTLTINAGSVVQLKNNNLAAIDLLNPPQNQIIYSVSSNSNGFFVQNSSLSIPINSFTQQNILDGVINFVSNAQYTSPSYTLIVSNGLTNAISQSQIGNIQFHYAPELLKNSLTINQGQTKILSLNDLNATNLNAGSDPLNLLFNLNNLQHITFSSVATSQPLTQFLLSNVSQSEIQVKQDNTPNMPSYTVTLNDGLLNSAPSNPQINFHYAPQLTRNILSIGQGQTELLTTDFLNATNLNPGIDTNTLIYSVTGMQHIAFTPAGNSLYNLTSFSHGNLTRYQVQVIQDGTPIVPTYNVSVSDGVLTNIEGPVPVQIDSFLYRPTLVNNAAIIKQGRPLTFTNQNLAATDPYIPANNLIFNFYNVQHGMFARSNDSSTPIPSCSQQDIFDNAIDFIQDDSINAPSYQVSTLNPIDGLFDIPRSALVSFITTPRILNNQVIIAQYSTVLLNSTNLSASDSYTPVADLMFNITNLQHATFLSNYLGSMKPVNNFQQKNITQGNIYLAQDSGAIEPSYSVTVSNGDLSSAPQSANVNFVIINPAPELINSGLTVSQGQTVILSSVNFSATDLKTPTDQLVFTVGNVLNGYFSFGTSNTPITSFTQSQINLGAIRFTQSGTKLQPSFTVIVTNNAGISTQPVMGSVSFSPINVAPTIKNNRLIIKEGQTVQLTSNTLSAVSLYDSADEIDFMINQVNHCSFSTKVNGQMQSFGNVVAFGQPNITAGDIFVTQDNTPNAPSYFVTAISPSGLASQAQPSSVDFSLVPKLPQLLQNQLTVTGGEQTFITSQNLLATDEQTPASSLMFKISGDCNGIPCNGQFEYLANPGVGITSFDQAVVGASLIFKSTIADAMPTYNVSVLNQQGLQTIPAAAKVVFNPPSYLNSSGNLLTIIGSAVLIPVTCACFLGRQVIGPWCRKKQLKLAERGKSKLHVAVMNQLSKTAALAKWFCFLTEAKTEKYYEAVSELLLGLEKRGFRIDDSLSDVERGAFSGIIARQIRYQINGKIGLGTKVCNFITGTREIKDEDIKSSLIEILDAVKNEIDLKPHLFSLYALKASTESGNTANSKDGNNAKNASNAGSPTSVKTQSNKSGETKSVLEMTSVSIDIKDTREHAKIDVQNSGTDHQRLENLEERMRLIERVEKRMQLIEQVDERMQLIERTLKLQSPKSSTRSDEQSPLLRFSNKNNDVKQDSTTSKPVAANAPSIALDKRARV